MPTLQRRRSDSGAQLIEWAALIVFALVVLGALTFMLAPSHITQPVSRALCQMFSVGMDQSNCDPEHRTDDYYEPERCMVNRDADGSTHSASIVVEGTHGTTFIREEFSDGSVRFVAVDESSVGGSLGIGGSAGLGSLASLDAEASVGAEYGFPQSAVWEFETGEEADQFEDQIRDHAKDEVSKFGFDDFESWVDDTGQLPQPESVMSEHELDLNAGAELGVSLGGGDNNRGNRGGGDNGDGGGTESDGGSNPQVKAWTPDFDPGAEVGVGVSEKAALQEHADGSTSEIYEFSGDAHFGADWVVDSVEPSIERVGGLKVTRDADGNMTEIVITQTTTDSDGPSITTTRLSLDNEEDRQVAEEWLGFVPEGNALPITWDDMAPTELSDGADPFQELLFNEGNTTRANYDQDISEEELGLQVKIGISVGYTYGTYEEQTQVSSAEYLGAPTDGEREYVEYEDCRAE